MARLPSNGDRALAAYRAQQSWHYRPAAVPGDNSSLYLDQAPQADGPAKSSVWPLSQVIAATLDLAGLAGQTAGLAADVQDRFGKALPQYWDGSSYQPCAGPPFPKDGAFYDDNAWAGLDLVRFYRMTGDRAALERGRQVFDFITTGWGTNASGPAPGGVYWVQGDSERPRNTCSNGPSAELGMRLYQVTGHAPYLEWARRTYDWVNGALIDDAGLYWDHIGSDGKIDRTRRTYNQGTMIGAGALLYSITGEGRYLDTAMHTARAALAHYDPAELSRHNPGFNAIFFRNLLHLAAVDAALLDQTLSAMQGYADHAWQNSRNDKNLFPFPAGAQATRVLHQAGMVQVFACLDWDRSQYDLLV